MSKLTSGIKDQLVTDDFWKELEIDVANDNEAAEEELAANDNYEKLDPREFGVDIPTLSENDGRFRFKDDYEAQELDFSDDRIGMRGFLSEEFG